MKPIIGIISRSVLSEEKHNMLGVYEDMCNAVINSGGIPIGILPVGDDINLLKLDGLIFQGGSEKEEYDQIMDLCRKGFEYFQDGKKRKFRPNEQLAMTFLLQANLGLRISDVLKLTPSTLKNDKLEIIDIAKKIDTYETSIIPFEDCCTIFVPKHPVINPNLDKCIEYEKLIDYETLIEDAVNNIEKINVKNYEFVENDLL